MAFASVPKAEKAVAQSDFMSHSQHESLLPGLSLAGNGPLLVPVQQTGQGGSLSRVRGHCSHPLEQTPLFPTEALGQNQPCQSASPLTLQLLSGNWKWWWHSPCKQIISAGCWALCLPTVGH